MPVDRFSADLAALWPSDGKLGIAVSGGPDSLALLILAADALPGQIAAATVDHGLRAEAEAEAAMVAEVCRARAIPHDILKPGWAAPPTANLQAEARTARYAALGDWAQRRAVDAIATAHHADDQAETLLMRLMRGAGLSGLAGVRARSIVPGTAIPLIRPLLGWRKGELQDVVRIAGLTPAEDRSNSDDRFDRVRVRGLLRERSWIAPARIAATAAHLADAEEALGWAASQAWAERADVDAEADRVRIRADGLPRDLRRRLLLIAFNHFAAEPPPGPKIARLLDALDAGRAATLAELRITPGPPWTIRRAPPRRPTKPAAD